MVIWLERRTRVRIPLALAVLLAVTGIYARVRWQEHVLASVQLLPITRADTTRQVAAITLELARGTATLLQVLDVLERHRVTATFFVNGSWVLRHPERLRKLAEHGHELALGGHWEERLVALPPERTVESVRTSHQALVETTGEKPAPFFRPPGGYSSSRLVETALGEGYHTVLWSLDARDTVTRHADRTASRVVARVRPGDIIRFSADDVGHPVAAALDLIISRLRERGFELVTVGTLLRLEGQ